MCNIENLGPKVGDDRRMIMMQSMKNYNNLTVRGYHLYAFLRCRLFLFSGMANLFNIRHNDVIYCTLPLYHSSGGCLGVSFCLVLGATMVIRRKFSASRFFEECIEYKATVSKCTKNAWLV